MAILGLSVGYLRITHPFATKDTEVSSVRLACIRHAASVNPEPGSNSLIVLSFSSRFLFLLKLLFADVSI